jgi:hypothetical protein
MMMVALVGGVALVASPAFAAGPPPPGPPACGNVAGLMHIKIYAEGLGAIGDNYVSIPAVSPLNNNPTNPNNNGFQQLCTRCGMAGTSSAILQVDPDLGQITTFQCSSAAAPPWQQGQAVMIRPDADHDCYIPGVECAQPYTSYGPDVAGAKGDNYWPMPLSFVGVTPDVVCTDLGLNTGDEVRRVAAQAGNIFSFLCGQVPTWNLVMGEGVVIKANTATVTGTPVIY